MGAGISSFACAGADTTFLLKACDSGDALRVRHIIEAKPELASVSGTWDSLAPLHRAAANGHVGVMQAVVEALRTFGSRIADPEKGDTKGRTFASVENFLAEVVNQRTSKGLTPLMMACANGHLECVKYLLSEDADPFLVDRAQLRTALHYAAAYGHADVAQVLLSDGLTVAVAGVGVCLRESRVRDMSGICRYVDTRAEHGMTALHLAALSGTLACVQVLLDSGASMMVRTVDSGRGRLPDVAVGSTPLHAAAFRGDVGIVQAMLQAHADALGTWGATQQPDGQREWENDGRIDLRSVVNTSRHLPYHTARTRGHRHMQRILNPTVPIDSALEDCRENESGYGPQKLSTLAAYALRQGLLDFLQTVQAELQAEDVQQSVPDLGAAAKLKATAHVAGEQPAAAGNTVAAVHAVDLSPVPQMSLPAMSDAAAPATITTAMGASEANATSVTPPQTAMLSTATTSTACRPEPAAPVLRSSGSPPAPIILSPFSVRASASAAQRSPAFASTLPASWTGFSGMDAAAGPLTLRNLSPTLRQGPPGAADGPADIFIFGGGSYGRSSRQRQRRSSPGDILNLRPQSAPLQFHPIDGSAKYLSHREYHQQRGLHHSHHHGHPVLAGKCGGGTAQQADSSRQHSCSAHSRSKQRLRTGSVGLVVERPLWGIVERAAEVDEEMSSQGSGGGGNFGAAGHRESRSRAILRTFSTLARKMKPASETEAKQQTDADIEGFGENKEPVECGICLDGVEQVAVNGCNHQLCVECAIQLCEVHKKPPLCPFCRLKIQGFHRADIHLVKFMVPR